LIVCYTMTGRRRISRFQRRSLSFLLLQVRTDFHCRPKTGDSSVAVVSIDILGKYFLFNDQAAACRSLRMTGIMTSKL
jgi:hypothetical protein